LSINRFERKKNLQLAISAFALFQSFGGVDVSGATLTIAGAFFFSLHFCFFNLKLFLPSYHLGK
jgi:hypothetical protein